MNLGEFGTLSNVCADARSPHYNNVHPSLCSTSPTVASKLWKFLRHANSYIGVKRSGHFMWKMGFIAGQYIFSKKSLILPTTAAHLATLKAQFQYNDEKLSDKSNYCVQEKWNKLFAL